MNVHYKYINRQVLQGGVDCNFDRNDFQGPSLKSILTYLEVILPYMSWKIVTFGIKMGELLFQIILCLIKIGNVES